MFCPYPNCGGDAISVPGSSCGRCQQPLLACTRCKAENRALARFCRNCGKPIALPSLEIHLGKSLRDKIKPRRLGEVRNRNSGVASFGGYLWLINRHGELYQASSGANELYYCATLPGGGFSFPLNIEEDDKRGPVIYTNNNQSILQYDILAGQVEKLFEIESNISTLVSGVLKRGQHFYFLTQGAGNDSRSLKCSDGDLSYSLGNLTFHDSLTSPLRRIGNDLWVITREKLLVFPNFSAEAPKELPWNPWHLWVTSKGVLYSEKVTTDQGDTQSVWRVTYGGRIFEHYSLVQGLRLTAKIAASHDGQTVTFIPNGIKIFDFAMNSIDELTGIVHVHNPQGILLSTPFLFWFETINRSVYAWKIRNPKVHELWSFKEEKINFSEFLVTSSSLYGFTEEEIWRWDLQGA